MSNTNPHEPLRGSCSCGRNQYLIQIPENHTEHAHVYFDSSRDNRRLHGTPLTAWLRVPLNWYQSHTRSYFPDETHSSIRRAFVPHHAPHTQRIFCGFCGTPLTSWTEDPREESDFMSVTIGSLFGDHQRVLEDLNLLPESESDEENPADEQVEVVQRDPPASTPLSSPVVPAGNSSDLSRRYRQGNLGGIPWFEELVEGSRLGRMLKARRGMGVSDDRSTGFEWEISEMHHEDPGHGSWAISSSSSSHATTGKRKDGPHSEVRETRSSRRRTGSS